MTLILIGTVLGAILGGCVYYCLEALNQWIRRRR